MSRDLVERELADRARTPHDVTLLGLCNDLLRGRWTLAVMVVCCAIGSAAFRLAQPRTYTATASFCPDVVQPLRPIAGAPSSFGVIGGGAPLGSSSSSRSLASTGFTSIPPANTTGLQPLDSAFYRGLLNSRAFVSAVAGSRFTITTPTGTRTGTAADVYGLPPGPTDRRIDDAGRRLAREIQLGSSDSSGILTLSVRSTDPQFARAAVERIVEALIEQNRRMSDARGAAQVAFLNRGALQARDELRHAQEEFARFLASNRTFVGASPIALEFQRRDADVVAKRQQYTDLALQVERAKLDQSRAAQILSVITLPGTPVRPDSRGVLLASLLGAVGGAALAALLVLTSAHVRRLRSVGFPDLETLEAEWRAARRFRSPRARPASPAVATIEAGSTG